MPHVETDGTPEEPLAVTPTCRAHLDQLIDQALVPIFGRVPIRDEDGDIPVTSGTAVVFVRTQPHGPVIKIWAEVAVEIGHLDRAKFEIEVLNRDHPFVKFELVDDRIAANVLLPAAPFVPEHLRQTLTMMCQVADAVDDDLAVRVGGRRFLEHDAVIKTNVSDETDATSDGYGDGDGDGEMHPALLTLHQLDAQNPGSVKPALAARICGYNAALLLTLIRCEEEQEIAWRLARDDATVVGDPDDEAKICEHERAHAQRTIRLLRKALRRVVEADRTADAGAVGLD